MSKQDAITELKFVADKLPNVFIYLLTTLAGIMLFFVRDTYNTVKSTHEKIIMIETKTEIKQLELDRRLEKLEGKILFTQKLPINGKFNDR